MDRINRLECEIAEIRKNLNEKENELYELKKKWFSQPNPAQLQMYQAKEDNQLYGIGNDYPKADVGDKLPKWAIERYSRQILLPDMGVAGQVKICAAKVLVVGAGGLGCPAASYLAGAGIGEIGIVDYDTVDLTNIHRQLLHGEPDQLMSKVDSAANALRRINSHITITPYNCQLDSSNALQVVSRYQLVLDCTDNVPGRYLLNDACQLMQVPLISGSALKMEGQLTIYNYKVCKNNSSKEVTYAGPCYRCLFASPPPPETVGSCSANGVCGPVPGVIGCLQALEAIKLVVGLPHTKLLVGRMLIFDGEDMTFRVVKLRPKSPNCAACSENPTITTLLDYEAFCRTKAKEKKQQEAKLKSERRKEEKEKRMTGQSYFGFRKTKIQDDDKEKWIQDVPKSERKIGPPCKSDYCAKGLSRNCTLFNQDIRQKIFLHFWNDLDWHSKKNFVRSLVDSTPPKRRRVKHKGEVSRKGDSKKYHLFFDEDRVPVCRVMFLNTLGVKEAMVRCWLLNGHDDAPRLRKKRPVKALNVHSYIEELPKTPPKCNICRNMSTRLYVDCDDVKNQYQLYNKYVKDMKAVGVEPASRKTFCKVFNAQDLGIFKPKNETDMCDLVSQHNALPQLDDLQHLDDHELKILGPENRTTAKELAEKLRRSRNSEQRHLVVDVRTELEFQMCRIEGAVNWPVDNLDKREQFARLMGLVRGCGGDVTFLCRRGNDSQLVARKVLGVLSAEDVGTVTLGTVGQGPFSIKDLTGGLHAWAKDVDGDFPIY